MSLALRGHRENVDHGDCHGGNFLALVAGKRGSIRSYGSPLPYLRQTPARTAKYLNHNDLNATIQTEKCLSHVSHRRNWNNTTRHTIRTIRNTRSIPNTTLWLFFDRPDRGPTWDIVHGPPGVKRRHCTHTHASDTCKWQHLVYGWIIYIFIHLASFAGTSTLRLSWQMYVHKCSRFQLYSMSSDCRLISRGLKK